MTGTAKEVGSLLSMIYTAFLRHHLDQYLQDMQELRGILLLAHKYDMPMAIEHLDNFISAVLVDNPISLQRNAHQVIDWLETAGLYGLSKVLRYCEGYVALKIQHFIDLECATRIPPDSLVRIMQQVLRKLQAAPLSHAPDISTWIDRGYKDCTLTKEDLEGLLSYVS